MAHNKKAVKIIGDRDIILNISNPQQHAHIVSIGKALSAPVRLQIMNLLKSTPMSIQEIANALSIPVSSTAAHIKYLEDAKLIITETQPGIHGSRRICVCSMQTFTLKTAEPDTVNNTISVDMPIGNYFRFHVQPTCGLANANGAIDIFDNPASFYSAHRTKAQLLWFQQGFIEYRFQNTANIYSNLQEISFSMEICSEAPGYLEDWPSDITLSINGHEITTFCSPGDFGGRRGRYTPLSWPNGQSQYGLLKTFAVRRKGGYLDGNLVNPNISISDLELETSPYISLVLEVKEDAKHVGGINLFGENFGDYAQGIVMNLRF